MPLIQTIDRALFSSIGEGGIPDSDFDALGCGFLELWAKPLDVRKTLARLAELLPPPRGARPADAADLQGGGLQTGTMIDPAADGARRESGLMARHKQSLAPRQTDYGWVR